MLPFASHAVYSSKKYALLPQDAMQQLDSEKGNFLHDTFYSQAGPPIRETIDLILGGYFPLPKMACYKAFALPSCTDGQ